jgi:Zn-dependent M28 family amino/carboxypeptidase
MKYRKYLGSIVIVSVLLSVCVSVRAQKPNEPSADNLRRHVTYLASDHLEGRRTGTPGANDAAHYIAGEFSQLGLRTAFQTIRNPKNRGEARSNYRQKFPYVAGVTLGTGNVLSLISAGGVEQPIKVSEDWMPLGLSTNQRIEKLPIVFVRYSITAAELNYDDYAGANANGKIAIAFAAAPDEENPHSRFERYKDPRWRAIAARNAGAKALLLIVRSENFREAHLSRLHYDNSSGDAGIPVIAISRQAAARILNLNDSTALVELERAQQPTKLTNATQVSVLTDLVRQEVAAYNIVGIIDGSDPMLKKEAIVIGAHYDHLGRGGEGSLAQKPGEVHHGADDNASGVAGMLELARVFTFSRPKLRRTIVFIAFSGEEEGLLGSNYYVNNPVVPLTNTIAMINMDMIGRSRDRKLVVGGVGTAEGWRPLIEAANSANAVRVTVNASSPPAEGMPIVVGANGRTVVSNDTTRYFNITMNEDGFGPSDHSSFYAKQVPVLFFWTGTHSDYHKPSDTADKINFEDEAKILGLVARITRSVDANDKRPVYTVAKSAATGRSTGFRVYLGTIPNYGDATDGLVLDGVREGSPAEKAGLKAGDKVVKLGMRDIRNVYDYTYALGEMKAGQEYELEVIRGTERVKLKITPEARN